VEDVRIKLDELQTLNTKPVQNDPNFETISKVKLQQEILSNHLLKTCV